MKIASGFSGVDSVSFDRNHQKLTVIAHGVDPVNIVTKLRRLGPVELLSIGPAQEVTKEEPKQHEEKYFNVSNSKVDDYILKLETVFGMK